MAIRAFDITGVRGLVRAEAADLPNVVGIAGPNGAGKSSLLEGIKNRRNQLLEPGSELLYVGPHRSWRSSQLSDLHVLGFPFQYEDILKQDSIPGFQYGQPAGLHFLSGLPRQAATADDSQALVKTAIVRLNNRQQTLVHQQYVAQGGQVALGTVPDLLAPLRQLVETLLPHLELVDVDSSQNQNIRVIFRRVDTDSPVQFDIDELSSGEKAAIALFLPFVEREAKKLEGTGTEVADGFVPITMLLDEPEIHLHPLLQLNVLEYMRQLARENRAQFIFTTQSPVLLDALEERELFLLSPPGFVSDNQLSQLVSSGERLEIARELTGSTHLLTRAKPIVFVEGETEPRPLAVTDERLIRLVVSAAAHWAIAPARGRSEVVAATNSLRSASLQLPGLPVFALVDADTSTAGLPDFVIPWPVAMIENLLLDVEALWHLLSPYAEMTGLRSDDDVRRSLEECAASQVENEVRIRLKRSLPGAWVAPDPNADNLGDSLDSQLNELRAKMEAVNIASLRAELQQHVADILGAGQALDFFHGKTLIRDFYKKHQLGRVFAYGGFLIELARACADGKRVSTLAVPAINRIRYYFPPDLADALQAVPPSTQRDDLIGKAVAFRAEWEKGAATGEGREHFREALGELARIQLPELRAHLFGLANGVGTS